MIYGISSVIIVDKRRSPAINGTFFFCLVIIASSHVKIRTIADSDMFVIIKKEVKLIGEIAVRYSQGVKGIIESE